MLIQTDRLGTYSMALRNAVLAALVVGVGCEDPQLLAVGDAGVLGDLGRAAEVGPAPDLGVADAGVEPRDTGGFDAADAGAELGVLDLGHPDAGSADGGPADTGEEGCGLSMVQPALRLSLDANGAESAAWSFVFNGGQSNRPFSAGARHVAFVSEGRLTPDDTADFRDVYLWTRATATVERVTSGDGDSRRAFVSADGTLVFFVSAATDVVQGDINGAIDVFVKDRVAQTTERVSVTNDGSEISGYSWLDDISPDGRHVVFRSASSNVVANDTNGQTDVFVRDRVEGTTRRVSVATAGVELTGGESLFGSISGDGRHVVFASLATNAVASDTNGAADIFLRDLRADTTIRVSESPAGVEGDGVSTVPHLTDDGRFVLFSSDASNLVPGDTNQLTDLFVLDRQAPSLVRIASADSGQAPGRGARHASISDDGNVVVWSSLADNLVAGDVNQHWDVFGHDLRDGVTRRLSSNAAGQSGDGPSHRAVISADARWVVHDSFASDLVSNDGNGNGDVFLLPLCP